MKDLSAIKIDIDDAEIIFFYNSSAYHQSEEKGIDTPIHDHPWFELQAILAGKISVKVADKLHVVRENEISFIPPMLYHNTYSDKIDGVRRIVLCFEMRKNKKVNSNFYDTVLAGFNQSFHVIKNAEIMRYLKQLSSLLTLNRRAKDIRVMSVLTLLFMELFDELIEDSDSIGEKNLYTHTDDYVFSKLGSIVSSPLIEDVTLDEVSKELFISKKKINNILKKKYNMTYKQKQILSKIENARKYFEETLIKVEEIASIVGYTNMTSFYKTFKKIVGCTPKEYRDKVKEKNDAK